MTLFALSLDGKARSWYDNLSNNSFATLQAFKATFLGKFGSKKEPRHLVVALTSMKKSDTKTMDEFNNRFTELSNSIPATHAPPAASTLDYYIEALSGKIQYQIRDKEPTTLLQAQNLAIKIDKNMHSSGESNIQGYSRSSTPLKTVEPKGKESSNEAYEKKLMDLTEKMQDMERKHLAQIKEVQNRVITVERTQPLPPPRTFPAKQTWQRKNPNHEQRPPHQLEATNVVEPYKPFCRACRDFHDESSCYYACYIQEHGFPEGCSPKASSSEPEYINYVDDMHDISRGSWREAK